MVGEHILTSYIVMKLHKLGTLLVFSEWTAFRCRNSLYCQKIFSCMYELICNVSDMYM